MFSWLRNFRIDHLSFWLGFVSAGIALWLYKKIKASLPKIQEIKDKGIEVARQHQLSADEIYYNLNVLETAQGQHLTGSFFPLETIIIPPLLMAPPLEFDPNREVAQNLSTASITAKVLPYLPDWPELNAQYPIPTLTPAEALQKGARIVLVGNAGAGKTTTLSYLASQIANRDESTGILANFMPVFLHILDIAIPDEIKETNDVVEILLDACILQNPGRNNSSLRRHLLSAISENRAVLLLDGMDELNQREHQHAVSYLSKLFEAQSDLRVIATGSSNHAGGLIQLGFYPLSLKPWNALEIDTFVDKWALAWYAAPKQQKTEHSSQAYLLKNWIKNFKAILSPLEWSLLVWGVYAGDLHGLSTMSALEAYIGRFSTRSVPRLALESFAKELLVQGQTFMPYGQANRFLARFNPDEAAAEQLAEGDNHTNETAEEQHRHRRKQNTQNQKVSSSERAISDLLDGRVFTEHVQHNIRFSHPLIAGYLSSFAITSPETEISADEYWELNKETLHFLAVQDKTAAWHKRALSQESDLLFTNVLKTARWLRDTPPEVRWRTQTLKYLLGLIHNQSIPFAIRARFIAAFVTANDPSVPLLFNKLLENNAPDVRWLAALGAGAIRDANAVPGLKKLFTDSDPNIRKAAVLALGSIWNASAIQAVTDALVSEDESLQLTAAEVMACKPAEGHRILREAIESQNLLVRRAAVFGLAQIKDAWTRDILERSTIEDSQWVVRNAAAQAVEAMDSLNPYIPVPLPEPSESPWLLAFAAKQGSSIGIDNTPLDLLLQALSSGLPDERISALTYLRTIPQIDSVQGITDMVQSTTGVLQNAAIFSFWVMSISGIF